MINYSLYPTCQYILEFWGVGKYSSGSSNSASCNRCTFAIPLFSWVQITRELPMGISSHVSTHVSANLQFAGPALATVALRAGKHSCLLDYDHSYQWHDPQHV